ncbi:MAG: GNAT family N-acetyltransferase [Armatimonadetes bacterium]|nr:GNAT family N-acetyltransferase [Armatimonadota bacterium]
MGAEPEEDHIQVGQAAPDDWPWMLQGYERTAWHSLLPSRRRWTSRRDVRVQVTAQVAAFRAREGNGFAALLARDGFGRRAGFVWVDESRHGFTGEARAYVIQLYVSRAYRRRGVGRTLMAAAEEWARARPAASCPQRGRPQSGGTLPLRAPRL